MSRLFWLVPAVLALAAGPAQAEHWITLKRSHFRGDRATAYLDTDVQQTRKGYAKIRGKLILDEVQTDPDSGLKYKEIRSLVEVNCNTLQMRHVMSTLYGPKGGVLAQLSGKQVPIGNYAESARNICERVRGDS